MSVRSECQRGEGRAVSSNHGSQVEARGNTRWIPLALVTVLCAFGAGFLVLIESTSVDAQFDVETDALVEPNDVTGSLHLVDTETASPGSIKIQAYGNDPTPDPDEFQHLAVTLTDVRPPEFFPREPQDSLVISSSPSNATVPAPWMSGNSLVISGEFEYQEGGDKWLCLAVNSTVVECRQVTLAPTETARSRTLLEDIDGDMAFTHADRPFGTEEGEDLCPLEFGANETGCPDPFTSVDSAAESDTVDEAPPVEQNQDTVEPEAPVETVVDEPALTCNDLEVTVNLAEGELPTNGDDVIRGTDGDDLIVALGGNDVICGLQGDDTIDAGEGDDKVLAAAGEDVISGGLGDDLLVGGRDDDTIVGGGGDDEIRGGDGSDELSGDAGSDRILGGNGHDIILGGSGNDTLIGNFGRDQLVGGDGEDVEFQAAEEPA